MEHFEDFNNSPTTNASFQDYFIRFNVLHKQVGREAAS